MMALLQYDKGDIWTQICTQREEHRQIDIMLPQARVLQEGERPGRDSSQGLKWEHDPSDTLILDLQTPEL